MNQVGVWARYNMKMNNKRLIKAQCILEYLFFLTAVIFCMIIATIGMTQGMRANLTASTQEGIGDAEVTIMNELSQIVNPPANVVGADYYIPPQQPDYAGTSTDNYGGPQPGYEE